MKSNWLKFDWMKCNPTIERKTEIGAQWAGN